MSTFRITLAYDGTDFVGWQRQANGTSIQELLEDALGDLDGRKVVVTGAGRTDARVHARFHACAKTYRYRIWNADVISPFERRYAWHVVAALDVGAMDAAARRL